jgi:hypothetical protein
MKNCYAIIKTRTFHGSETRVSLVMDATGLQYLSFATREQARAWIRKLEGRTLYLEPNESGPPSYTLTEVGSQSFCDAYRLTREGEKSSLPPV